MIKKIAQGGGTGSQYIIMDEMIYYGSSSEEINIEDNEEMEYEFRIVPYKPYSGSYKALRPHLHKGCVERKDCVLINWGKTQIGNTSEFKKLLNKPSAVGTCSDKLRFFNLMSKVEGLNIPEYTDDIDTALKWTQEGHQVMGRTKKGNSGSGIIFFEDGMDSLIDFLDKDLYVKYLKKKSEFRVHIFGGKVIDVQRKVLRKTDDGGTLINNKDVDFRVRTYKNGFIFQRNDITVPDVVYEQAKLAFNATELDFGAVDVIYNSYYDKAVVLEINTAPGLEGTTLENYIKEFKKCA